MILANIIATWRSIMSNYLRGICKYKFRLKMKKQGRRLTYDEKLQKCE